MHKIKFNIGDTVICKKDFENDNYSQQRIKKTAIRFHKNKTYRIKDSSYWDEEKKVIIYEIDDWSFVSTNEIHNLFVPEFEDYFYTNQEVRKMKLNKINNERD